MQAALWRMAAAVLAMGVIYAGFKVSRGVGAILLATYLVWLVAAKFWLPRAAHAAFCRGDPKRAALWYRLLWALRYGRSTRGDIAVSLAACALAQGRFERASARLDRIAPEGLAESAKSVWLNNKAYILLRRGGDAQAALELAERALELRPGVPGFRHTRALALLELGQLDEAIRELERVWGPEQDEVEPELEAERCFDLGRAWKRRGESDYSADYFRRAHRASATSRFSEDARVALGTQAAAPELEQLTAGLLESR